MRFLIAIASLVLWSGPGPSTSLDPEAVAEPLVEPPSAVARVAATPPGPADPRRATAAAPRRRVAPPRSPSTIPGAGVQKAPAAVRPAARAPRMFGVGLRSRGGADSPPIGARPRSERGRAAPAHGVALALDGSALELDELQRSGADAAASVNIQLQAFADGDEVVDVVVTDGRVAPFVVGRTECADALAFAGGRSIGLTAGLQVGVTTAWHARFQLSQEYVNSLGEEVREPRVSLALRRRF